MWFHGIMPKTTLLPCFDSGGDIEMWEDKWRSKMGDQNNCFRRGNKREKGRFEFGLNA
jgi:hypothetical protein